MLWGYHESLKFIGVPRVALLTRMRGILFAAMGLLAFGILEFIRSFIAKDRSIR